MAFDLKGAFNLVNKKSLEARLRAKRIPAVARRWIASFMSEHSANIGFDDFETEVDALENAVLAQSSPLLPVLVVFFNSDLADQSVDFQGRASAYIDDYFRWQVRLNRSVREQIWHQLNRVDRSEQHARSRFV